MGAVARLGLDVHPSMDGADTFAHIDEPQARMLRADLFEIETDPPVVYG